MNNSQNDLLKIINEVNNTQNKQQTTQNIISGLNNSQKSQLSDIMSDPQKINKIINSPAAKQIMQILNGKSNG